MLPFFTPDFETENEYLFVLFEILNSTDAQTTKELRKNLFSNIKVILEKYKNIDPETKEMIAQTANALIKIVKNNLKNT